ncbi:MAG: hypothetical protein LC115_04065 [Bacteroidia bacterium]|nr:hypothetical protein [Bacteroidia bacterium]
MKRRKTSITVTTISLLSWLRYCVFVVVSWLFFADTLSAQQIAAVLTLDKTEPIPRWFEYSSVDKGLVTVSPMSRASERYWGIFKYDENLKRVWSKQLLEKDLNTNIFYLAVIGERIFVFIATEIPRHNTVQVSYCEYSITGQLTRPFTLLQTYSYNQFKKNPILFEYSLNRKRLICYNQTIEDWKPVRIQAYLFDSKADSFSYREINLELSEEFLQVVSIKPGNKSSIFILSKYTNSAKVHSPTDYFYKLFRYRLADDPNQDSVWTNKLSFGDRYVTDLIMKPDPQENVFLGGVFAMRSNNSIIGTLYVRVNSDNQIEQNTATLLSNSFLKKYLTDRQIQKKKELTDFYLDDLILRSDGGMILMAEQYFYTITSYRDISGFWVNRELFHYDDIMVISLSDSGNIEWSSVVPKSQTAESKVELSYADMVGEENIYFFYRDYERGIGSNIYYATVNWEGQVSIPKPFFKEFYAQNTFYRSASQQVSNQNGILAYYSPRGRQFVLVKILF